MTFNPNHYRLNTGIETRELKSPQTEIGDNLEVEWCDNHYKIKKQAEETRVKIMDWIAKKFDNTFI